MRIFFYIALFLNVEITLSCLSDLEKSITIRPSITQKYGIDSYYNDAFKRLCPAAILEWAEKGEWHTVKIELEKLTIAPQEKRFIIYALLEKNYKPKKEFLSDPGVQVQTIGGISNCVGTVAACVTPCLMRTTCCGLTIGCSGCAVSTPCFWTTGCLLWTVPKLLSVVPNLIILCKAKKDAETKPKPFASLLQYAYELNEPGHPSIPFQIQTSPEQIVQTLSE